MKMINKLLFSIFIILTITHTVQNTYIVLSYISYTAKVMSGNTLTDEDFHTIQIQYVSTNPTNQAEFNALEGTPTPLYFKGYIFADTSSPYSKPPINDQTTINYVYENYLPGAQQTNLIYARTKPDNSVVKKYYVMYDMVTTCPGQKPLLSIKIKYFYCFADARTFFESTDAKLGSGSGNKLIHNTINFEATQTLIKFNAADSDVNLRDAVLGSQTSCTAD